MRIDLMQNASENNVIGKNLTVISTGDAVLKRNVSALDIELDLHNINTDILNKSNYVYIPKLGRYYFISNVRYDLGGNVTIMCHTDVLQTFADDIRKLRVIADKSEEPSKSNMYIDDNSFITENRIVNQIYNFPSGFNNTGEFILITVGG